MKIILLAGGSGTRLWPISRSNYPKQFLRLGGDESFLQKTIKRNLALVKPEDLYIVTGEPYSVEVSAQAREIEPSLVSHILCEPISKNTAPAMALALQMIEAEEDELFLFCPSDHIIAPLEGYCEAVKQAEALAKQGFLVTFGVRPNRPETGYGYLKAAGSQVERFVEKPDFKQAQHYLESGGYFWNAGMFAFTKKVFFQEAMQHCPLLVKGTFEEMPALSIDYALMEKSERVAMVPLELTWSDIGSWENVYDMLKKDGDLNAIEGDVCAVDTTNSLIYAQSRHVSTIGLDDVLVVETDDAVLVADKSKSQQVKEIVGKLRNLGKKEVQEHLTVRRPWGSYIVLMEEERYKIKRILVNPKQQLSLQMHYHRSEHWVVVSGTARVTIGEEKRIVHEGESIFVPKSSIHRVENPGIVPLQIIEVQVGEYLGEDDIIRFEDIYGRLKEEMLAKSLN